MRRLRLIAVFGLSVMALRTARADTAIVTVLHNFGSSEGEFGSADGSEPVQPPVEGTDGNFYGTTYSGGADGNGTVYMMTPQGTLTTIYNFQGYDGVGPRGLLYETNGLFYGTTQLGGAYLLDESNLCCGTVFTITPQGTLTTIYSFTTLDGNTADSGLIPAGNGDFYGTTYGGGTTTVPYDGTNSDTIGDTVQNPPGTVYRITPQGTITTLHSFAGPDGANPGKEAVVGLNGNIYGTTLFGGSNDYGTIYTITPQGTFTSLYSFTNGLDGAFPKSQLIQGIDGNFYGTAQNGGGPAGKKWCNVHGCGSAYMITPEGTLTVLHDFEGDPEPAHPGSLTMGIAGNYYGTSIYGGTDHEGTVYMMTPEGAVTTLFQFDGTDGEAPLGGLIQAGDGSFYGATTEGGKYGDGVIFRMVIDTNCAVTVDPTSFTVPAKGGPGKIAVKAVDCNWAAASTDSFITISGTAGGSGDGTVDFTVAANTNRTSLSGSIDIAGQVVTVNQDTGGCTYALSPKNAKFKATGGKGSVKVAPVYSDCDWSSDVDSDFITITSGQHGTGDGTLDYTVATNTETVTQIGTMLIAGEVFTVEVAGATCETTLGSTNADFSSSGGSSNVTVTANGTNCTWKAVVSGTFIHITSATSGTGDGTIDYTVSANTKPAVQKGTITVGKAKLTITESAP